MAGRSMTKISEGQYWKIILYRGCNLTHEHIAHGFDVNRSTITRILLEVNERMFEEFEGDSLITFLHYVSIKDDE